MLDVHSHSVRMSPNDREEWLVCGRCDDKDRKARESERVGYRTEETEPETPPSHTVTCRRPQPADAECRGHVNNNFADTIRRAPLYCFVACLSLHTFDAFVARSQCLCCTSWPRTALWLPHRVSICSSRAFRSICSHQYLIPRQRRSSWWTANAQMPWRVPHAFPAGDPHVLLCGATTGHHWLHSH
ncbi:hypothetical protein FA95DRAFT_764802 [Auriscalpium vulgare]|uniref:Uncharacterized protein n=1 Tax=Auriscalpium vulgare TaxID=40419 RepID=A0ACB8RC05_9AGAM|nr:hypothetical protein FA95DRAFT_764802 [Auriscalpium vulgare]